MSLASEVVMLPRLGGPPSSLTEPISGPTEAAFTTTFGTLLPPAQFVKTTHGKAAYYELSPSSAPSGKDTTGTPDRVLLIHGVQTPAIGMLPLARHLQQSFPGAQFVLVDLWGHGLSDTPVVPHDKALFHELLDAVLDQLNWPSVHIVGYSFGASLTAGYVASRASRVQSFVIIAPAGFIRFAAFEPAHQEVLRGHDEVAVRKFVLAFLEGGDLIVPTDWQERVAKGEIVAEAVREWHIRNHHGHMASVSAIVRDCGVIDNDDDFIGALRTGVPCFAILGEEDDLCSQQTLHTTGFEDVAIVPKVGHGLVRQKAMEVATLISDFWVKLENTKRS